MQEKGQIEKTTCFSEHKKRNLCCKKEDCRLWIESKEDLNCTAIAAEGGEHTLQEIGDIFGVTRMRICQMEKIILKSLNLHSLIKKSNA